MTPPVLMTACGGLELCHPLYRSASFPAKMTAHLRLGQNLQHVHLAVNQIKSEVGGGH